MSTMYTTPRSFSETKKNNAGKVFRCNIRFIFGSFHQLANCNTIINAILYYIAKRVCIIL